MDFIFIFISYEARFNNVLQEGERELVVAGGSGGSDTVEIFSFANWTWGQIQMQRTYLSHVDTSALC